ncbi:PfaD family polyunsaturated fatty acid/polyketide biosynthesis protein [Streptomyces sp. DH12]|uniref:PfaD family polyunsaturated fatty acid/polyketide biosynthesis protein n=1 Tax=Streptomyces sp. DH12 TaxID=2857010 RepID=UPI001E39929B|nr:PfaD family polyunsaturated fatty acid/polyketide biosynthesis protein [Streptomyces sp. DH12]
MTTPTTVRQDGDRTGVHYEADGVYGVLADLDRPCYVVGGGGRVGVTPHPPGPGSGATLLAVAAPQPPERLGSSDFRARHGLRYAYMAGAMAGGIASEELVLRLAGAGYLASFGAAGLPEDRVDQALARLARSLGDTGTPYACNLIHHPLSPEQERACVDACLRHRVPCLEASAFVRLTPDLVRYRLAGLRSDSVGGVRADHRVVAKVSRQEVAELFMRPAPEALVAELVARGEVTQAQADLARHFPMADDITVEADSGGHTDRRPLVVALPAILRLRDRVAREHPSAGRIGIGAAGGIATPEAITAAFALGACYVVTGSVNQSATEAGTSPGVKRLLAQAGLTDYAMAPAADLFEQGGTVQVLSRGTRFPGTAARLYRLYREHAGLDELPARERRDIEERILRRPLATAWRETADYLLAHQPDWHRRAEQDPKFRMAMVFRWYLAMASRWAISGAEERRDDWQIWCGPAMGAFNGWTAGTALALPDRRRAVSIADHLMRAAAFHTRVTQLRVSGLRLPAACAAYRLPPV